MPQIRNPTHPTPAILRAAPRALKAAGTVVPITLFSYLDFVSFKISILLIVEKFVAGKLDAFYYVFCKETDKKVN
jgi:hypothetical protein